MSDPLVPTGKIWRARVCVCACETENTILGRWVSMCSNGSALMYGYVGVCAKASNFNHAERVRLN